MNTKQYHGKRRSMVKNKKRILIIAMIGLIIYLCACGGEKKENSASNIVESSIVLESDIEDEIISNIIGTYVGEQGSGITLYEDGKATYYFNRNIERNDSWVYENGSITIYLANLGYDIYANVKNEDTSSLVFKSDDVGWIEEPFAKVSSEQEKLSPDDYDKLLESMYGIKDEVTYTTISVGGVDFWVSSNYGEENSKNVDGKEYQHRFIDARMIIGSFEIEVSNEEFTSEKMSDSLTELFLDSFGEDCSISSLENTKIAGLCAKEYTITVEYEEQSMTVKYVCINNTNTGEIIVIAFIYPDEQNEKYNCENDCKKFLETAKLSGEEEKSDSLNESATSSTEISNVREFLDSYETFINEYVDFIKEYYNSDNALEMFFEYTDLMTRYTEFVEKVDTLDEDEMSPEDAAYYVEVLARCNKKLSEIYQLIQ